MPAECTGVTATFCPAHGNCSCGPGPDGTPTLDDAGCPLHDTASDHAEQPDRLTRLLELAGWLARERCEYVEPGDGSCLHARVEPEERCLPCQARAEVYAPAG